MTPDLECLEESKLLTGKEMTPSESNSQESKVILYFMIEESKVVMEEYVVQSQTHKFESLCKNMVSNFNLLFFRFE